MVVSEQYDICLVSLDPSVGSEIKKARPCVILSPNEMNRHLNTVQVAAMTTNTRFYPWRIPITFQGKKGMIALDHIRSIDKGRILKKLSSLKSEARQKLKSVLYEMLIA